MLSIAELVDGAVRVAGPTIGGEWRGVEVEQSASSFALRRRAPGDTPVYYRVDYGCLEWSSDLSEFVDTSATSEPDSGALLAMIHGFIPPPDVSPLQGIRQLAVGASVRLDASGVAVTRSLPEAPTRRQDFVEAVGRMVASLEGDLAIAYSGGLSSAFLAVCALRSGRRPTLVHADLGSELARRTPAIDVPGLKLRRVPVDLSELLDHHRVTGAEPSPPMPDTELPRQLLSRLADAGGTATVSGALLKDSVSARMAEAGTGLQGWRLIGSEPFHVTGILRTLREARELMRAGVVHPSDRHDPSHDGTAGPEVQPIAGPPPSTPPGGDALPGLSESARVELQSARRSYQAVWNQHLEGIPRALGRVEAGLHERGLVAEPGGRPVVLPAVDPDVLAAAAGLPERELCGIRRGAFQNYLPMRRALTAAGFGGFLDTSPGFRLRLAAAIHLHRERDKIVAELNRDCALAERGLIDVPTVVRLLRDGPSMSERALPLLRLVWLDQWLRGR